MLLFRNHSLLMLLASALLLAAAPGLCYASTAPVALEYRGNFGTSALAFGDVPSEIVESGTSTQWSDDPSEVYREFTESAMTLTASTNLDVSQATSIPEGDASKARVPEPAALLFFGTGLIGLAKLTRKQT